MITNLKTGLIALALISAQSSPITYESTQPNTYVFKYLSFNSLGEANIISINPLTHAFNVTDMQLFPKNTSAFTLYPQWISPTGTWLTLQYYPSSTTGGIRLVNLDTSETTDIASTGIGLQLPDNLRPDQVAAWSPDGRYLAFSIPTDKSTTQIDAYLYSMATRALIKLNTHQGRSIRFAWSPDSSQLAIEGESETPITILGTTANGTSIDILNVKSNQVVDTLTGLGQDAVTDLCNLQWSPNSRYISYINGCDITDHASGHEAYLWDINTNNQIQMTSLATDILKTSIGVSATYNIYWINSQQLMIGMFVQGAAYPSSNLATETIIYNADEKTSTVYTSGQVQGFSISPLTDKVVMSVVAGYKQDFTPISSQLRLGSFSENVAANGAILLDGYDYSWSPDGKYLAYRQAGTDKFLFMDVSADTPHLIYSFDNSSILTSVLSANDIQTIASIILPIGWVGGNSPIAGTPAVPTPTTQPSATATPNGASVPGSNQIGGG